MFGLFRRSPLEKVLTRIVSERLHPYLQVIDNDSGLILCPQGLFSKRDNCPLMNIGFPSDSYQSDTWLDHLMADGQFKYTELLDNIEALGKRIKSFHQARDWVSWNPKEEDIPWTPFMSVRHGFKDAKYRMWSAVGLADEHFFKNVLGYGILGFGVGASATTTIVDLLQTPHIGQYVWLDYRSICEDYALTNSGCLWPSISSNCDGVALQCTACMRDPDSKSVSRYSGSVDYVFDQFEANVSDLILRSFS